MVISTEQAADMVDLALRYRDKGVVAVDIAGDEMVPMHQLHIDAFKVTTTFIVDSRQLYGL